MAISPKSYRQYGNRGLGIGGEGVLLCCVKSLAVTAPALDETLFDSRSQCLLFDPRSLGGRLRCAASVGSLLMLLMSINGRPRQRREEWALTAVGLLVQVRCRCGAGAQLWLGDTSPTTHNQLMQEAQLEQLQFDLSGKFSLLWPDFAWDRHDDCPEAGTCHTIAVHYTTWCASDDSC